MKVELKSKNRTNVQLLTYLSNEYHKRLRQRERLADIERIRWQNQEDRLKTLETLNRLANEQLDDARAFFEYSIYIQYDLDDEFVEYWLNALREEELVEDYLFWKDLPMTRANLKDRDNYSKDGKGNALILESSIGSLMEGINDPDSFVFRDFISSISDDKMSSDMAYFWKTMDDNKNKLGDTPYKNPKDTGAPRLLHRANASACAFCKFFDIEGIAFRYNAARPHDGCRCTRIPLGHSDILPEGEWVKQYEEVYSKVTHAASERGDIGWDNDFRVFRSALRADQKGEEFDYDKTKERIDGDKRNRKSGE